MASGMSHWYTAALAGLLTNTVQARFCIASDYKRHHLRPETSDAPSTNASSSFCDNGILHDVNRITSAIDSLVCPSQASFWANPGCELNIMQKNRTNHKVSRAICLMSKDAVSY